jgi:hypothetical protein
MTALEYAKKNKRDEVIAWFGRGGKDLEEDEGEEDVRNSRFVSCMCFLTHARASLMAWTCIPV